MPLYEFGSRPSKAVQFNHSLQSLFRRLRPLENLFPQKARRTHKLAEIKIFAGKFSKAAARWFFHQRFRFTGRFADSIARRRIPWQKIPNIRQRFRFASGETLAFMRWKIASEIRLLPAASTKGSLDILTVNRISFAVGCRTNELPKNQTFSSLPARVAGNPAFSLKIRTVSRQFTRVAGNPPKSLNFSPRSGSFRSLAEVLIVRLQTSISAEIWSFGRNIAFSSNTLPPTSRHQAIGWAI